MDDKADQNLPELLNRFSPSREALLAWFQSRLDDRLLGVIAVADYGKDYQEHFRALRTIRDNLVIPSPLDWIPKEVLELQRWSEPENQARETRLSSGEGHLSRAFVCTVLIMAAGNPVANQDISRESETSIQLVASSLVLGPEVSRLALRLLTWRMFSSISVSSTSSAINTEERPFLAFAILLLATALKPAPVDGPILKQLAEWVMEEEARAREALGAYFPDRKTMHWLLGLTRFNQKKATWLEVGRKVLLEPSEAHPAEAEEVLQLIGIALCGDKT